MSLQQVKRPSQHDVIWRGWLAAAASVALFWSSQAGAQAGPAPTKAACARAYESAQESRASGHLLETRERLKFCARAECPGFVRNDCARWLEEVERELPSIILSAPNLDPDDAKQAVVTVDGRAVPGALSGEPLVLDPGRHDLVVERPGEPPLNRTIVAQQGVQNRVIELHLGGEEEAQSPTSEPRPSAMPVDSTPPLRPYSYAAFGVGALGLGTFAVLGILGSADEDGLKQECPVVTADPTQVRPGVCSEATVDRRKNSYEREFLLADIGLVTGIVGIATGTVLLVLSAASSDGSELDSGSAARLQFDWTPAPGGGHAVVSGAF